MKYKDGWDMIYRVAKSGTQVTLEAQGCVFNGQEPLDNHEIDPEKECYCGRPNYKKWRG